MEKRTGNNNWFTNVIVLAAGGVLTATLLYPETVLAQQTPINLLSTSRFAILAGTEITDSPTSAVTGDVGLSPAAESYITGFSQTDASGYATSPQVNGQIFASDMGGATAVMLTQAQGDLTTAYNNATGRTPVPTGTFLNPGAGNMGGLTLAPGLYKFTSDASIAGSNLTLTGDESDVWIFQIASSFNVANGINVVLAGGAQASNIFWQVGASAALGTTVIFEGTIMAHDSITLATGATLNGRALAKAAVTLQSNAITIPKTAPTESVTLVESTTVNGAYTYAPGQTANLASKTITAPQSGGIMFYRVVSARALTIHIAISGNNVVITYK